MKKPIQSKTLHLLIGPALFLLIVVFPIGGMEFPVRVALGTIAWISWWFVTQPVPQGVTGLLPVAINAVLNVLPMNTVIACYSAELLFLVANANIITMTWERTGVDKRIAAKILSLLGPNVKVQIAVWFTVATLLSSVLPNIVVVVMLCSISYSMLKFVGISDMGTSKAATTLMLAIIWGAEHGGMGTPLGGAMCQVITSHLEELLGGEFFYIDWVIRILPFFLALYVIGMIVMLVPKYDRIKFAESKEAIQATIKDLPPMRRSEWVSLLLFVVPTILAFTRPLWQELVPGMKPAYCFTVAGLLSFFIRQEDGEPLMTFKYATDNLVWGILFLIAGADAMGNMITNSGADVVIAGIINSFAQNDLLLIFVLVALTVIVEEVACSTAAASIFMPIVIAVCATTDLPVYGVIFITTAAVNSAFAMPVSSRAVPLGYGVKTSDMFRQGLPGTILSIFVITGLGYLLLKFWPMFSIL